jgi:hypothetical protein
VIPLHSPLPDGGCTCGRADCSAAGKHPRIKAWQQDASADPDQIRTWWTQWPEANVGLLMGQASGVIAIDVDPRNGGSETIEKLTSEHGGLPHTVMALTGGGGVHFLFAAPSRLVKKNNNGSTLGRGVDLQGDGSLIVVAPSRHKSGGVYEWASGCAPWECELAPLPAWVLDLVDARQQRGKAAITTLPDVILEGQRDETLFSWGRMLYAKGLTKEAVLEELRKENAARCKPPLPDEQVRKIADQAEKYVPGEAGQGARRDSVAKRLVDLALQEVVEFWHTPEGVHYASVQVGEHIEHWPLESEAFRAWLEYRFYREEGRVDTGGVDKALGVLRFEAMAGHKHPIYTRVGEHDGAIYLDLADEEWRAVKITPTGWEVVPNPPARFRRSPGQDALPVPERGGTLDELRRFVNVSDAEWPLLAAWLLFALRPSNRARKRGSYPVLILGGTKGSAKSTTSSVLRCLIDPHEDEMGSVIPSDRELAIIAQHNWVVALDNVSVIQEWFSNALCRLASGLGYSTRALYTNSGTVVFSAKRPILLNGIGDFATRSDLLERALLITCPRINEKARKGETEFWEEEFEPAWPRLLGAALDCLCKTLAKLPEVKLDGKPRMADFAVFATAAARAGVFDEETFWRAYGASQAAADAIALEGTPVAQAVFALLKTTTAGVWEGTATELLHALNDRADDTMRRSPAWPKTANWLSKELDKIADNLRARGVSVERGWRHGGTKMIVLTRCGDAKTPSGGANCVTGDANGDANQGARSQAPRGFAPTVSMGDAKFRKLLPDSSVEEGREKEGGAVGGEAETPGEKFSKNCPTIDTIDTAPPDDGKREGAASPGDAASDEVVVPDGYFITADELVDDEEPTATDDADGKQSNAPARQEEFPPLTDDDFIFGDDLSDMIITDDDVIDDDAKDDEDDLF